MKTRQDFGWLTFWITTLFSEAVSSSMLNKFVLFMKLSVTIHMWAS